MIKLGKAKRHQGGVSTSHVVMSAYQGENYLVFPIILSLHVPEGSVVADVTYGKGVFWRHVKKQGNHMARNILRGP